MARIFISFVHEDEKIASAVQDLLQAELDLREGVFLSSDKSQVYAGDLWLQKIKEALSLAEIVILMLSKRSVARPWVNFEAGAAWLADKTLIPVCYGNLSKYLLPHPYSGIQALNLPSDAYYLLRSVTHQLNLEPMSPPAVYRGTLAERGAGIDDDAWAFGESSLGIQGRLSCRSRCRNINYLSESSAVPEAASLLGFPRCLNTIMHFIELEVNR